MLARNSAEGLKVQGIIEWLDVRQVFFSVVEPAELHDAY